MSFSTFLTSGLATTALFASVAQGHLIIANPVPFRLGLQKSPLTNIQPGSATSNYPCQLRGADTYTITAMNNMKAGTPQLLSYEAGGATHGGGTVQLSLTLDLEPTANSTFKLFQVFEGDATTFGTGNDPANELTFELPPGLPNGRATLSWLWYNHVGDREVYMNCAPLDITGGSDSHEYFDSLPNQYLINLPTSECSTVEGFDQKIPFPGQFIIEGPNAKPGAATGPSCAASAAAQTQGVQGYKSATSNDGAAYKAPATNGDVTGAATGAATQTGAASQSTTSASSPSEGEIGNSPSSGPGASTISTVASSSLPAAASSFPTMLPSGNAGIAAPAGAAASGVASPSGGGSSSSGAGCTSGTIVCNGPTQFGICNFGTVVFQDVAAGTTCSNGVVQKRGEMRNVQARRHAQNAGRSS